jgi:hypothetical protein
MSRRFASSTSRPKSARVPILRIDVAVVADLVAEIDPRRRVERCQPDGVDTEIDQVVQSLCDAVEVPDAITVVVLEATYVDLVEDTFCPPVDRYNRCTQVIAPAGRAIPPRARFNSLLRSLPRQEPRLRGSWVPLSSACASSPRWPPGEARHLRRAFIPSFLVLLPPSHFCSVNRNGRRRRLRSSWFLLSSSSASSPVGRVSGAACAVLRSFIPPFLACSVNLHGKGRHLTQPSSAKDDTCVPFIT